MAYYVYYPCPGSTGAQFYSNVAPSYPGAFIQFTTGGPELAPYLGKCYHVAQMNDATPPSAISINWATTTYNAAFNKCEDCVEQPVVTPVYQLTSCCNSQDTFLVNLPDLPVSATNILIANSGTSGIPAGCYDVALFNEGASGTPTLLIDINYVTNAGCTAYPFICNSYCGVCNCVRVKVKPQFVIPGSTDTVGLFYWTCNLTTNEDGDVIPLGATLEVPMDGSWTDYVCAGGFIEFVQWFDYETEGLCNLDIQTDEFVCPKYYQLQDCLDTSNTLCVANDLYNLYITNSVVQISGYPDTCWQIVQLNEPCDFPKTVIITETFSGCEDCLEGLKTYYKLTNCLNPDIFVYTDTDMSTYVGQVVVVNEFPEDCWEVEPSALAVNEIPVTGIITFNTCSECNAQYYVLEDCNIDNPLPNIYTAEDLSAYVGSVITLEFCPEVCWQVSETDATPNSDIVNITGSYATCEICEIAVLPCQCSRVINRVGAGLRFQYYDCNGVLQLTPVLAFGQASPKVCAKLWLKVDPDNIEYFGNCVDNICPPDEKPKKSIRPGYNTPACTPEKYEKIVCNFSEAMYDQLVSIRVGVDMCCTEDILKWEIQKELIYLKSITDPDYACTLSSGCDCTTSTAGLTPCIPITPPPVICHIYEMTVMAYIETSITYINCAGDSVILIIPAGKTLLQYVFCGQEGQTFTTPPNAAVFAYNETTAVCTDV